MLLPLNLTNSVNFITRYSLAKSGSIATPATPVQAPP